MTEEMTPPPAPAHNPNNKQTSALAVTSLICGLLGWTLMPWLGSLVAIVTGHMARSEIRNDPNNKEGDGMAIAGLVLGYVMVVTSLLAILAVVLLFGGLAAFFAFLGMAGQLN